MSAPEAGGSRRDFSASWCHLSQASKSAARSRTMYQNPLGCPSKEKSQNRGDPGTQSSAVRRILLSTEAAQKVTLVPEMPPSFPPWSPFRRHVPCHRAAPRGGMDGVVSLLVQHQPHRAGQRVPSSLLRSLLGMGREGRLKPHANP